MKIIISTIPKFQYRCERVAGALKVLHYPDDKIQYWRGHDAMQQGSPPLTANIALKAIGDGFPFFERLLTEKDTCDANIHIAVQHYEFCRIYRHIGEQPEGVYVVSHDDHLPILNYWDLAGLIEQIQAQGDFKMLQYHWWLSKKRHTSNPRPATSVPKINHGITGLGDKINIVTPEGARWMSELLRKMVEEHGVSAENIFYPYLEQSTNDIEPLPSPPGVYSTAPEEGGRWDRPDRSHFYIELIDHSTDSNIMTYEPDPETGDDFKYKVSKKETNHIPDIDWHYYKNVLPKLKETYDTLHHLHNTSHEK